MSLFCMWMLILKCVLWFSDMFVKSVVDILWWYFFLIFLLVNNKMKFKFFLIFKKFFVFYIVVNYVNLYILNNFKFIRKYNYWRVYE